MSDFGDSEPEDSWDADDHPIEQLENLRRRVLLLIAAGREGRWADREELRARDLDEDLVFVINRLRGT